MSKPFGIISDTHNHAWSGFSKTNQSGVNSRLQIILDETVRAAQAVKDAGGDTLIHAGDMFHVRGNVAPSVLNPTLDTYRHIVRQMGMSVVTISGNHDLEGRESDDLGSAMTALKDVGVEVHNMRRVLIVNGEAIAVIPWRSTVEGMKIDLRDTADLNNADKVTAIIHAPIDGVIMGIPDHGLTPDWLSKLGLRRIFAGHYHNHVDFGNGIYSVGALAHQTWSDVGSKAGFLIVDGDDVTHYASHAPSFIDLDPTMDSDEVPLVVDGNYVRAKVEVSKQSDVEELRGWLLDECQAAGVVIHPVKDLSASSRTGSTVKAGASINQSISEFIKERKYKHANEVGSECQNIMQEID